MTDTGQGDGRVGAGVGRTAERSAVAVAALGAAATGLLAVGHAGVEIALVTALGPGGSRPVWPAAAAFTVAAVAYAAVAVGLARRRAWAVPLATVVFGVTVLGALLPYRGVGSLVGAGIGVVGLVLLAAARGRSTAPRRPA